MHYLDRTLGTLAENLALDEALLLEAEAGEGDEVLRLWEWPAAAVVLGAGGRLAGEVNEAACQAEGVPILRRASGGGAVLLGKGCLVFSLVLAYERSPLLREIASSYRYLLGRLREALADFLPGIACAGTSDLAAAGRKFSGNSQQRKRGHLLHHGTILYDFDLERIDRCLPLPPWRPAYRKDRPHAAFLMNLPARAADLQHRLRATWQADQELASWPEASVQKLVAEKYSSPEWVRRR